MSNTYKITQVNNGKLNITYTDGRGIHGPYLYSQPGFVSDIWPGYINEDRVKWAEMLNDLLTPGGAIITRMRAAATATAARQTDFTTIMAVIQNGVNGFPDTATLQTLLRLNWGFTSGEKTIINTYLANNNFTITIN